MPTYGCVRTASAWIAPAITVVDDLVGHFAVAGLAALHTNRPRAAWKIRFIAAKVPRIRFFILPISLCRMAHKMRVALGPFIRQGTGFLVPCRTINYMYLRTEPELARLGPDQGDGADLGKDVDGGRRPPPRHASPIETGFATRTNPYTEAGVRCEIISIPRGTGWTHGVPSATCRTIVRAVARDSML
jgi:hypothetical protein